MDPVWEQKAKELVVAYCKETRGTDAYRWAVMHIAKALYDAEEEGRRKQIARTLESNEAYATRLAELQTERDSARMALTEAVNGMATCRQAHFGPFTGRVYQVADQTIERWREALK